MDGWITVVMNKCTWLYMDEYAQNIICITQFAAKMDCMNTCDEISSRGQYGGNQVNVMIYNSIHIDAIWHNTDIIMSAVASQITGVSIVCSTVSSGAYQRKHQSSAPLVFVRWISILKSQQHRKCFHLMTSLWYIPCNMHMVLLYFLLCLYH